MESLVKRSLVFLFGIAVYFLFIYTTIYAIGFVGNIFVPKGIDSGVSASITHNILIDISLIATFGVQHVVMARPAFKKRWLRLIPNPAERSVYVLFASLSLLLLFWWWHPITILIWNFSDGILNIVLSVLFWIGWIAVVLSTFLINHFDLFGLRQVYLYLRGTDYTPVPFKQPFPYKYVRHPLMLAFLIAFWATPQMSVGHLLFSLGMTVFIFIGIAFEERDLIKTYGESYKRYRQQVSMIFPFPKNE